MKIDKSCRTYLITDTPSEIDEFGGSHKRVAEAIAELIINEDGGKSIGLEGEWGTGKSTVISLLNELLKSPQNNEDYKLFLFDAWAHESDPLRKIFLEQLLDFLRKHNWITEKQWEEKWKGGWEEFIGQKTTSTTESSPKITKFGGFLIIASFFIPLGLALINNALRNNAIFNVFSGIEMGYVLNWQLLTGSILSLLPLLGFLLVLIGYIREKTIKKDEDVKINWAIFAQKYDVQTTTLSTKTPNPTSVEFEKFFTELINIAISNKNRHLIIVLDNLDRISPTDALSILSTL
ncbi:KAP family NTPase [Candidatus Micrarchaeota archaeon]|nr:KAP family NTPase [Candidatus Micrarchaeota archaeon]